MFLLEFVYLLSLPARSQFWPEEWGLGGRFPKRECVAEDEAILELSVVIAPNSAVEATARTNIDITLIDIWNCQ